MDNDTTSEKIKAMRCDISCSAYGTGWSAYLGGGTDSRSAIHASGDTLESAVDAMHGKWVEAGSPEWRVYTEEEVAALEGECKQWAKEAAAGKEMLAAGSK